MLPGLHFCSNEGTPETRTDVVGYDPKSSRLGDWPTRTSREGEGMVQRTAEVELLLGSPHVTGFGPRLLAPLLFVTVASASVEGYLNALHPQLSKLPFVMLLVVWFFSLLAGRRLPRLPSVAWLSGLLMLTVLLSVTVNWHNPYWPMYAARWAPFLVLVVILVDLIATVVEPVVAIAATVLGALAAAMGAIYSVAFLGEPRATGPLDDPNDLAYLLAAAFPLILLAPASPSRGYGVMRAIAATVVLIAAVATLSRGGGVAVAFVVVWALLRRIVPVKLAVSVFAASAVGLAVAVTLAAPQAEMALAEKAYVAQANVDSRELRWAAAARMIASSPLLGVGPGGVQDHYVEASRNAELSEPTPVTHNMYLEVGAELGLVGLSLFAAIIVMAMAQSETLVRTGMRQTGLALQGSMISICTASIFLSQEYYMPLWATIAVIAGLYERSQRTVGESL